MARISDDDLAELMPLSEAAIECGCATDPQLIDDLVAMWRLDPDTVLWRDGKRYVRRSDVGTIRSWVTWWIKWRPRRPKRRPKRGQKVRR